MTTNNQSLEQQKKSYQQIVNRVKPKPPVLRNILSAFFVGGLICVIGQLLINFFVTRGLPIKEASGAASSVLVFVAAFLTGLGFYDEIGRFGGAGSIVPITGFANSMVSPALEFKHEGFVTGVGARLFTVAGPVLVFGIVTAWVIGLIYYLVRG